MNLIPQSYEKWRVNRQQLGDTVTMLDDGNNG